MRQLVEARLAAPDPVTGPLLAPAHGPQLRLIGPLGERSGMVRCLALNASFEPLTMVPVRRALRLVIEGKAEIVEAEGRDVVRSERLVLPRPAIIRLVKFVHVPRRFRRQVTNTFLFARDGYRCQYCHRSQLELRPRECLTRDHLVPLSRGGGQRVDQRGHRLLQLQHPQGQPAAGGVRHAPAHPPARAALRAPGVGGAAAHHHPGQVHPAVLRRGGAAGPGRDDAGGRGGAPRSAPGRTPQCREGSRSSDPSFAFTACGVSASPHLEDLRPRPRA